ncbi:peptidase M50 [Chitinimonas koreensis]|uniref:peptidase M50 n=1 Tax=Chitinimonas koreensis TaxID=356302 RepID=UPI0004122903|nr:peptidase M50 [Chitinimonas koreensis]QNM95066.1 peptidase M50 [Chitinimonas koreensis]
MTRSLFSSSWHSVADLRPRLVPHVRMTRHVYRGEAWYVVQDQTGGRYHRLSSAAHAIVAAMDGKRTVQSLWEEANSGAAQDFCTQNEIVDLLMQLHAADLLQADVTPDSVALFERHRKKKRETVKQWLTNPLSLKLPLLNPDRFLARWAPSLAWCFGWQGALLWLAVVLPAGLLAWQHWGALTHNLSDQVLSSSNLMVMALVYPVVKLLHELGHGFATRVRGGSVPALGLMFLVFAPVPYVDASSSASFRSKWQRAQVAAAGMLVELFVAALALYVWLLVEPGVVRAVAFNVMLIAGVSTVVVNGNPLLRYDGYYILADLIEMPNLAQRGQRYYTYLWDRYVFGARELDAPAERPAEKRWLIAYTPLAWCYRTFVTVSITLFIAGEFFVFGVLLALWGAFTLVGMPLWKAWRHVVASPGLQRTRGRAVRVSLAIVAGLLLLGFVLPLPLRTRATGVVWLPDQAILHAGGGGFFAEWLAAPGQWVRRGAPLYRLRDAALEAELAGQRAKYDEVAARYAAEQFSEPVKAAVTLRQLEHEEAVLRRVEERAARLVGHAETDGVLVAAQPQDMPGRYYKKGEQIGYVLRNDQLMVRAVVPQDDIYLVRTRWRAASLRPAGRAADAWPAEPLREISGGLDELPTAALGLAGGGAIATQPNDPNGVKTIERVFWVDLALPAGMPPPAFGERVHVRFEHGSEPLAWQGLRRLRQLFLTRFGV